MPREQAVQAVLFDFGNTLVVEEPGRHILDMALDPIPFAPELIGALRPRYQLGIVSNTVGSGDRELREALRRMAFLESFGAVITSRDAGVAKPDPAIFRLAALRLGVDAGAMVMVGDRLETDIAGAHAAGIPGIWLCHEAADRGQPTAALARFVVGSLREVPRCLQALQARPLSAEPGA